jgi:hypothetical protein
MKPYTLAGSFSLITVTGLTHAFYQLHPDVDHCDFAQYLDDADDFGQPQMFSYSFDRALNQKDKLGQI